MLLMMLPVTIRLISLDVTGTDVILHSWIMKEQPIGVICMRDSAHEWLTVLIKLPQLESKHFM